MSYHRFLEWIPSTLLPLCLYLQHCCGDCCGVSFIDSTSLNVCHHCRIDRHQVFQGLAAWGKASVDCFFGLKLHLVVNAPGELLNLTVTPGNVDDRRPVPELLRPLFGKVFANRGYVSQPLAAQLLQDYGIEFFAKPQRNMKNRLMRLQDKLLTRKCCLIKTIIDQPKNISQIEHSRHCLLVVNCFAHLFCGLIAYLNRPKKPGLDLDDELTATA